IGAYGDRNARTPRIDRLASQGGLFERAVAAAPITLPAHVSLFTGRYPYVHGVRENRKFSPEGGFTLPARPPRSGVPHAVVRERLRPRSPVRARDGVRSL